MKIDLKNLNLAQLLGTAMMLFQQYQQMRDAMKAAGHNVDPSTGLPWAEDADLIKLFKADAQSARAYIDQLLVKHGGAAAPPEQPEQPTGDTQADGGGSED